MEVVKGLHRLEVKLEALKGVASDEALNRVAWACGFVVESHCKQNIQQEPSSVAGVPKIGLIDTGFMLNATYTIGPNNNGAIGARAAASGRADRIFLELPPPVPSPGTGEALVTNGADYFIWVHQGHHNTPSHPVLRRAAVENDAEITKVAKDMVVLEIKKALGNG